MMNFKISLIDNDYAVRAETDVTLNGQDNPFSAFLKQVKEELLPGQTAYLEIENSDSDPVTFEISQFA